MYVNLPTSPILIFLILQVLLLILGTCQKANGSLDHYGEPNHIQDIDSQVASNHNNSVN